MELVGGASGLVQYVNRRTTFLCKSGLDGACTHIHTSIYIIAYEVVPLRIHLQGPFEVDGCQSTGMLLRSDSYHEHLTCLPDDESKTTKQCRKR